MDNSELDRGSPITTHQPSSRFYSLETKLEKNTKIIIEQIPKLKKKSKIVKKKLPNWRKNLEFGKHSVSKNVPVDRTVQ